MPSSLYVLFQNILFSPHSSGHPAASRPAKIEAFLDWSKSARQDVGILSL